MASALTALKRLHKVHLDAADIPLLLTDVAAQTDRGAAIMLSGLVESGLAQAIKTRMPHIDSESLFGDHKPLHSFESKMVVGQALGIYGPKCVTNLKVIKEVRNFFAHVSTSASFETAEVANYINTMDNTLNDLAGEIFGKDAENVSPARNKFSMNALLFLTGILVNEVRVLKAKMKVERRQIRNFGAKPDSISMPNVVKTEHPDFMRLVQWIPQPLP